jgi:lipoprotein NlpD
MHLPSGSFRFPVPSRLVGVAMAAVLLAGCAARIPAPVEERGARAAKPVTVAPPAAAPAPESERGPETYTVKRGDTLHAIALDHGLDYRELAAWNNVENVNVIRVGQVLRLAPPGEPAAAAVTTTPLRAAPPIVPGDARPAPSPSATPLVVPGSRNADNYKVQPKGIKEPYSEQALRDVARAVSATPPAPPPPAVEASAPATVARVEAKPVPGPVAAPAPAPSTESRPAAMDGDDEKLEWTWPASGKLITGFSDNANLKGIDISGKAGQPVLASAAGKVVYAGTGIRGYGKLVIVKHSSTYLSAYAHNKEIVVKEGQQVARGQKIAEMGNTDAEQVMLHFEIRRQGKPVDPLKYLPPA